MIETFSTISKWRQRVPRLALTSSERSMNNLRANVTLDMIPAWMRPKKKIKDPEAAKSEAMKHAGALSRKALLVQPQVLHLA